MGEIPRSVLSEHLSERMQGRKLLRAVFLSYNLDPAFFEHDVLPVFFDQAFSHHAKVRLAQMEEALRHLQGPVTVLYDPRGLVVNGESATLDWRRIPVRLPSGYFHAKNIFLLVENARDEKHEGPPTQSLLVASLSANLTRDSWFKNVECCHVEELSEETPSRVATDLVEFIQRLQPRLESEVYSESLKPIRSFLREQPARENRTVNGRLLPRFYGGGESLPKFLDDAAGHILSGMNMEVVAPFVDKDEPRALRELLDTLKPKEAVVYLPRDASDAATCSEEYFTQVSKLDGVTWGKLPQELGRLGKALDSGARFVHAKVYRFFGHRPNREVLFVGSVNLTSAGHHGRRNVESGFLVEVDPVGRPEFWLKPNDKKPREFKETADEEGELDGRNLAPPLTVRFHWDSGAAEIYWDDPKPSSRVQGDVNGVFVFAREQVDARVWRPLSASEASKLRELLLGTALMTVTSGEEKGFVLVQEECMARKPSFFRQLSLSEILEYWSTLTAQKRAELLERWAGGLLDPGLARVVDEVSRLRPMRDTMFDKFAGCFIAFNLLEQTVREELNPENEKRREGQSRAILFGSRHDSLKTLLDRALDAESKDDLIQRYVILQCATQSCRQLKRQFPEFWAENKEGAEEVAKLLDQVFILRSQLLARNGPEMDGFLSWFEDWFKKPINRRGEGA